MPVSVGFSQIFSQLIELFGFIYTSGFLLWDWLCSPLSDNVSDSGADSILGEFLTMTPLELMFGPALMIILVMALVKFMKII